MKRILLALGLLAALATPALAQKTKASLTTEININFADNNVGAITPGLLRTTVTDIVNSYIDINGASTFACASSKWVSSGTLSAFTCTQPSFGDITGTLPLSQGGTNASLTASVGGIVYSTATAFAVLAGTGVSGQCLLSGSSAAPSWGSCPGGGGGSGTVNAGTAGQLGYYASNGTAISGVSTASINSSPTLTGNWVFTPTTGDGIHITTATNTLSSSLVSSQAANTGGTLSAPQYFNSFTIAPVNFNASTFQAVGFLVNMNCGGTVFAGAGCIGTTLQAALDVSSPNLTGSNGPLGAAIGGTASAPAAGTNTGAGAQGAVAGANIIGQLTSGATNFLNLTGLEVDAEIFTGASAKNRWGVAVVSIGQVAGASGDAAFPVWASVGAAAWKNILFLSNLGGGQPLATTGCFVCTDGTSWTIAKGIDLSSGLTITGNAWASPGSAISGTGIGSFTQLVSVTGAVNDGFVTSDGTVTGILTTSALFTHSAVVGTSSNHPLAFVTNNVNVGSIDTSGAWTVGVITQAANTAATGLTLADNTAATSGNQQFSPGMVFTGQGWKTAATAASQPVNIRVYAQPIQGLANPQVALNYDTQINNGGYSTRYQIIDDPGSGGNLYVNFLEGASVQFRLYVAGNQMATVYSDVTQTIMGSFANIPTHLIANNLKALTLNVDGSVKFTNAISFSANASVATVLGSVGPAGSHTTVQKWLAVQDNTGTTVYIPAF